MVCFFFNVNCVGVLCRFVLYGDRRSLHVVRAFSHDPKTTVTKIWLKCLEEAQDGDPENQREEGVNDPHKHLMWEVRFYCSHWRKCIYPRSEVGVSYTAGTADDLFRLMAQIWFSGLSRLYIGLFYKVWTAKKTPKKKKTTDHISRWFEMWYQSDFYRCVSVKMLWQLKLGFKVSLASVTR